MANCLPASSWVQGCPRAQLLRRRVSTQAWDLGDALHRWNSGALRRSVQNIHEDSPAVSHQQARCAGVASTSSATTVELPFAARPNLRDHSNRLMLKNLTYQELEQWCVSIATGQGYTSMREFMGQDDVLSAVRFIAQCLDVLAAGATHRVSPSEKASQVASLDGGLALQSVHTAADGTRKMVFSLTCGEGRGRSVEAVLIPVVRSGGSRPRTTLCISSQVGCAQNCQFCFTGRMGLLGNLSAAQIVEQVVEARRLAEELGLDRTAPLTNIVFMGMGEPLANVGPVLQSLPVLMHPLGLHFSHNKITVSTVGLVPELRRLATETSVQVALSLHATTDEVRSWIAPINRKYPLDVLLATLRELFPRGATPGQHGRHILIEYVMLRGVNDTLEDSQRLLAMTADIECKFNLIVFNPFEGTSFRPSLPEQVKAFRSTLIQGGRVCTVRDSRGDDKMAACGQLGFLGEAGPRALTLKPPERLRKSLALTV